MAWYSLRFGLIAAAISLCAVTTASTAPMSYTVDHVGTFASMPYDGGTVLVIAYSEPRFVLPAAIERRHISRDYPTYRPLVMKHASIGAALRPTSITGWRSGRTRHLASG